MKKNQYVADLKVKAAAESIFLVKYIQVMESRDGKSYLNLILSDKTGDIESRKWSGAQKVAGAISRGDYVFIKGKVNLYQSRMQLIVNEIAKASDEDVDKDDYINKSDNNVDEMYEKLVSIVEALSDVYIRDLLKMVLFEPDISKRLRSWQAGKTIHHAYQGGLLEHILSCTDLALILSKHYKVNENYVVAGCILHDICKIYELTAGPIVDYTDEGKLVGHLVKGVEIVERYAQRIPQFPHNLKIHLKHVLLSHHGELEYGSPKVPQTSEAYLVHLIDLMDSKMNSFEAIKASDKNPGPWSAFVRHMDRIVYKEELPFYSDYLPAKGDNEDVKAVVGPGKKDGSPKKKGSDQELTHSMASALKGFKVDN